jgi:acetylornithine deacetylase/succinyl-diaminopimelate desuccinylase-like protein
LISIEDAALIPAFWKTLEALEASRPVVIANTVQLAEVASPTGFEAERAMAFRALLAESLGNARIDEAGNVLGHLPGTGSGKALLVTAALDSPCSPGTEPVIEVRPDRLTGWGACTNAYALAVMAQIAGILRSHPIAGMGDIWFVATVGSEMAGDLRGICSLFPWLSETCSRAICLQGPGVGRLDHWSVGTYRGELTVLTPGGHAWRDSSRPNALALAMQYCQTMKSVPPQGLPRGMFNPSKLDSGDAWNALPSRAVLRFELRSDDENDLQRMILRAQEEADALVARKPGCRAFLEQKGFRHATGLYPDHPLVDGCRKTQAWAGIKTRLGASSADASVCLHWGVAAVTLGLGSCVGIGTSQETLDIRDLRPGLRQALAAILQCALAPKEARIAT